MQWNILGRKLEVRKLGEAFIVKAWMDGNAVYGEFTSIKAIEVWVEDRILALDTDCEVTEVCNVMEYKQAA